MIGIDEWKRAYSVTMEQLLQLRERGLSAGVYTQTTDIEGEVNGIMTYDRMPKADAGRSWGFGFMMCGGDAWRQVAVL